jgi:hypothetical protein
LHTLGILKIVIFLLAAGLLSGCKPKSVQQLSPDSVVPQTIVLKDVTTGGKPGVALQAGSRSEWSYFGEKRTVSYTTDDAGRVTTIRFSVGTDMDGRRLQEALEKKLSDEHRRRVAFECRAQPRRLAAVDNLAVTDTYCTLRSPTQKLTIKRQRPDNPVDTEKYGNLRIIFDSADVTLEETAMEEARTRAERDKSDAEYQRRDDQAKRDI